MDATTSRYHEVYERWKRDRRLLGRGRQGDRLDRAAEAHFRREPAFTAAGSQAARSIPPTTGSTAMSSADAATGGAHLRSPRDRQQADLHLAELLDEVATFGGVLQDIGVEKGDRVIVYMPMIRRR